MLFSQFMFQLDVNRGSSKTNTDFHILFLFESESVVHCFSAFMYVVLVNGTGCTGIFLYKNLVGMFPVTYVLC